METRSFSFYTRPPDGGFQYPVLIASGGQSTQRDPRYRWDNERHRRDGNLHFLQVTLGGQGLFYEVNGAESRAHPQGKGTWFFASPGGPGYRYHGIPGKPWSYLWVGLTGPLAREWITRHPPRASGSDGDGFFKGRLEHLLRRALMGDLQAETLSQTAYALLIRLCAPAPESMASGTREEGLLAASLRLIRESPAEASVESLAVALGYHPKYFSKLFREASGQTPHQIILDERLALARRLLERTAQGIPDIAEKCGFSDRIHFARHFRRKFDLAPREWRSRHRASVTVDEVIDITH